MPNQAAVSLPISYPDYIPIWISGELSVRGSLYMFFTHHHHCRRHHCHRHHYDENQFTCTAISFSLWSFSMRNLHFFSNLTWKGEFLATSPRRLTSVGGFTCSPICWLVWPRRPWLVFSCSSSRSKLSSTSSFGWNENWLSFYCQVLSRQ